jgi:hypothetical protein
MVGKRVAGDLYLHRVSLNQARRRDKEIALAFERLLSQDEIDWNVVRIGNDSISFLKYQDFFQNAFPALLRSVRFEIVDGKKLVKDFSSYKNRPILHRKELLLPDDHPSFEYFSNLTNALEKLNLFFDAHKIGFHDQWERRLAEHGVRIEEHEVRSTK